MDMTVGQAIARLQSHGHTFLASELEKTIDISLKRIGSQQIETEPTDKATQDLDTWLASRGYSFPSNSR